MFGLELGDVDLAHREVHVRSQLKRMTGQPAYLGEPKSPSSRRTVELPQVVADALTTHLDRFP